VQVLVHPDPFVLERELVDRVAAAQEEDRRCPVLVLVPTVRLAGHVQRRLARARGALLGVEVLHYQALVHRLLEIGAAESPVRLLPPRLLLARLETVLAAQPRNEISRFADRRPGALGSLMGTLRDLRKAGIDPETAARVLEDPRDGPLLEIYRGYHADLKSLEPDRWVDEAGLVVHALPHAPRFARRFHAILQHGAYELIGVHLDLLRAMANAAPVTVLLPVEPEAPATAYAERFARRHLLEKGQALHRITGHEGGLLGARLSRLYREDAPGDPLDRPEAVRFRHAQGEAAEVTAAVRYALEAVCQGTPPDEIALVARSLAPYAPTLDEALDENLEDVEEGQAAPPWTSSLGTPLRREPVVRDLLGLLRTVADDFPRAPTAALLASPRIRWEALLPDEEPPRGDRAESWSRRAGILGGLAEWTEELTAWAARPSPARDDLTEEERAERERRAAARAEEASRLARALEALHRRVDPETRRGWREHADLVEKLIRDILPAEDAEEPSPAVAALLALCGEMRQLGDLFPDPSAISFTRMVDWLERAVAEVELYPRWRDRGGFRVLDAMQARGLTHERVFLLGFHGGLFPRVPVEDPFLGDESRRRLREATGRPLPVKSEGEDEEHLLLALMLGSAKRGVDLSWQRADAAGRTRSPSLALREVARVVLGRPDLRTVLDRARTLPAHPAAWLDALAREPGLLAPREEALLATLRSADLDAAAEDLAERYPHLEHGLTLLRATESFAHGRGHHDGRVGRKAVPARAWAVSALERLGHCPLQFFFRHVLRVYELQEEARAETIAPWDLGERVHLLLESLYGTLREEGLFAPGKGEAIRKRAHLLLAERWDGALGSLVERLERRLPSLWRLERERWRAALDHFLEEDLARLAGEGASLAALEETRCARLDLGQDKSVEVTGRFDRRLETPEGLLVGDYKTSGRLARRGDVTRMLRASTLQVPLYRMLAGEGARVELLGVGPEYGSNGGDGEPGRILFAGFDGAERDEGFRETMRVVLALLQAGRFPLRSDRHCHWCVYRPACRHNHPPTLHRDQTRDDAADYRDLQRKTKTRMATLDLVRAGEGTS
jgi:ATP-dependent helicase/nuclease subunit B